MQRNMLDTKHNRDYVSFHRTLRNGAGSGMQLLEPTEQTEQAARRTARFGDPKGRVNEDPGAVPMEQTANPSLSAETESVDRR